MLLIRSFSNSRLYGQDILSSASICGCALGNFDNLNTMNFDFIPTRSFLSTSFYSKNQNVTVFNK